jgi:hypothetical protein
MRKFRTHFGSIILMAALLFFAPGLRAADTLPSQLADDVFWKLSDSSSEPGGRFQSENFLSNETGFQMVIPTLLQVTRPDGVYLGVGPEQNFTYITAMRPKMAFIVDIRRQNMLEHMIYKALFELSENRADFLARLFSMKRPAGLSDKSTVIELFNAYSNAQTDNVVYQKNLQDIKDVLLKKHKFGLTAEDQTNIEHVYSVFRDYGPDINYSSGTRNRGGGRGMPNYVDVMIATDPQGVQRSYLANEENYRFLRDLEGRNMLVPLTGDFGGTKAIRAVGQYLKDHGATVSAFYLSNVEQYLFQNQGGPGNPNGGASNFYANVATLPLDARSTFIRSRGGQAGGGGGGGGFGRAPNELASMEETLAAVKDGRIRSYIDVFNISVFRGDVPPQLR